jgi:acyl carrier protein phosphodiesterase
MNFLAHQYLSFDNPQLRIGNFIADFVRGNKLKAFPISVLKGIELHRKIDSFTDNHSIVKESVAILKLRQGKYTPVILDVYYDYFLAKNWNKFSEVSLEVFAKDVYADFKESESIFPLKMERAVKSIMHQDWLTNYQYYEGIKNALQNIEQRASFDNKINKALSDLKELETELEQKFLLFFPDIIIMAKEFIKDNIV